MMAAPKNLLGEAALRELLAMKEKNVAEEEGL